MVIWSSSRRTTEIRWCTRATETRTKNHDFRYDSFPLPNTLLSNRMVNNYAGHIDHGGTGRNRTFPVPPLSLLTTVPQHVQSATAIGGF